ncbi:alkaline shock response membrane anchor protein AmaP [Aceticella autotrophica]|uniref:Alkaline shock response membrane anchor protein AmaP n=1 Tax=Aceticella autotrophica TaxID=2755338 RepID=A0A974Y2P9_9THEO|nr:alkaline shock response membrane anchor protein AmaP [Aceticella autotrophica]MDI6604197.1 alkaline shock response membrane anchor protein AmaP [Thermoanaerobacteraceae bacterium]QSZ26509.1 alkaline shock response membrane anchor protein AmaP [Aceticella autotrophica]
MKVIDRILIIIFIIVIVLLSILLIGLGFNLIKVNDIIPALEQIQNNWLYALIGILTVAASGLLFFSGTNKNSTTKSIIINSNYGDIGISFDTIISLAEREARNTEGIKTKNIYVSRNNDKIVLNMDITVLPDLNIPDIIKNLQKDIKEYIEGTTSIYLDNIYVNVINLNSSMKLKVE